MVTTFDVVAWLVFLLIANLMWPGFGFFSFSIGYWGAHFLLKALFGDRLW